MDSGLAAEANVSKLELITSENELLNHQNANLRHFRRKTRALQAFGVWLFVIAGLFFLGLLGFASLSFAYYKNAAIENKEWFTLVMLFTGFTQVILGLLCAKRVIQGAKYSISESKLKLILETVLPTVLALGHTLTYLWLRICAGGQCDSDMKWFWDPKWEADPDIRMMYLASILTVVVFSGLSSLSYISALILSLSCADLRSPRRPVLRESHPMFTYMEEIAV